jgi:hypothetical protein
MLPVFFPLISKLVVYHKYCPQLVSRFPYGARVNQGYAEQLPRTNGRNEQRCDLRRIHVHVSMKF